MSFFGSGGLLGNGEGVRGIFPNNNRFLYEVIKNTDTLAGEFLRTVDDTKEELYELCTDGFVEMVIKGNQSYKTSFEIKGEATEKIAENKKRYETRCYEFNKYLDKLNTKINTLYSQKVELAKRLNRAVINMPNIPEFVKVVDVPEYSYQKSSISIICECAGLETGIDIKGKRKSAHNYWEDANDYEVYIANKISEINKVQAFLDTVKINLEEEKQLLYALEDSLNKKRELKYLEIEKQLHILIAEYILDADCTKNERYLEAIERLKCIS